MILFELSCSIILLANWFEDLNRLADSKIITLILMGVAYVIGSMKRKLEISILELQAQQKGMENRKFLHETADRFGEASQEFGNVMSEYTAVLDKEENKDSDTALNDVREKLCDIMCSKLCPRFFQYIDLKAISHKNDDDAILDIIENDISPELDLWLDSLDALNDEYILNRLDKGPLVLEDYSLRALNEVPRQCSVQTRQKAKNLIDLMIKKFTGNKSKISENENSGK